MKAWILFAAFVSLVMPAPAADPPAADAEVEVIDEIIMSGRWAHQNSSHALSMVTDTRVYSLPVIMSEIREVRSTVTNKRVSQTTVEQLARRGLDIVLTGLGNPTGWYTEGAGASGELQIALYPVPVAADNGSDLTVYGLKRPVALAITDEIPLPEEFVSIARSGIRGLVRYNENNLEGANLMFQRFDKSLQMLNSRFNGAPRQGSRLMAKRGLKITPQMPSAPGGD